MEFCYEKDFIRLPRQHLPQSDGGVCDEGYGRQGRGRERVVIDSAATSTEELGNPVYPPARRELAAHGVVCGPHTARQMTRADYDKYDLLIGMDSANIRNMTRICGGDPAGKIHRLLDYTARPGDVADPWYTGDFSATWRDVAEGCRGLLKAITSQAM